MKKKLVSIMLVAAMALSVVACGSSKGNSAKTDGTEAMASSVSKTPDNQISINLASEPQSIDPALNSAVDGGCMIVNSFAGLYTYDKDGKLIPQLASDMPEVSDDETVYTVKMIKSQWSNGEEVTAAYDKYYKDEYFVRVLDKDVVPQTRWVEGSNFADVNFKIDPRTNRIVMMGAIDNRVKGAAGQAIQNMNLLFGLTENTGLKQIPMFP